MSIACASPVSLLVSPLPPPLLSVDSSAAAAGGCEGGRGDGACAGAGLSRLHQGVLLQCCNHAQLSHSWQAELMRCSGAEIRDEAIPGMTGRRVSGTVEVSVAWQSLDELPEEVR